MNKFLNLEGKARQRGKSEGKLQQTVSRSEWMSLKKHWTFQEIEIKIQEKCRNVGKTGFNIIETWMRVKVWVKQTVKK